MRENNGHNYFTCILKAKGKISTMVCRLKQNLFLNNNSGIYIILIKKKIKIRIKINKKYPSRKK